MREYRIAVIPGDGIGKEVVPEGIRVLEAAGSKYDIRFAGTSSRGAASTTQRRGA
jgi:tartrate dehydrogenase/decarboxylase / D-malate dehydrogenase